jgi:hypothetical protein
MPSHKIDVQYQRETHPADGERPSEARLLSCTAPQWQGVVVTGDRLPRIGAKRCAA